MSADYASIIQPINTCISAEMYDWRATLAMNLGGTPGEVWRWIWSGFVLPIDEDWTDDMMKVSCVGWAQRMAMRQIKRDKTWTAKDDAYIFEDTLAEMNLPASRMARATWCRSGRVQPEHANLDGTGAGRSPNEAPRRRDSLRATTRTSRSPRPRTSSCCRSGMS